jgi:hypothetical protein
MPRSRAAGTPPAPEPATRPARARKAPSPAASAAASDRARLRELQARVAWWTRHVAHLVEGQARAADVYQARRALEECRDRVHHHQLAQRLRTLDDPEARAAQLAGMALADGSHVAAGAHERALQALRALRLEAEQRAREAEAARTTPGDAFDLLIQAVTSLPDGQRRRLADALGATVHVIQELPPEPPDEVPEPAPAAPSVPQPAVVRPAPAPASSPTGPSGRRLA